jgi:hypothetical protein
VARVVEHGKYGSWEEKKSKSEREDAFGANIGKTG